MLKLNRLEIPTDTNIIKFAHNITDKNKTFESIDTYNSMPAVSMKLLATTTISFILSCSINGSQFNIAFRHVKTQSVRNTDGFKYHNLQKM